MPKKLSEAAKAKAAQFFEQGQDCYLNWEVQSAIEAFEMAVTLYKHDPDYYLALAQAYLRLGDYDAMRVALGKFLRLEPDSPLTERYEAFFGSAMDAVETTMTQTMVGQDVPLEVIGAGMQMWFEFRLARGRKPINLAGVKPKVWAAALDYTVRKVNFHEVKSNQIAQWYGISHQAVTQYYKILVDTLDVMPCDYRYFRGPENPLDKLVDAAVQLEELEARFYQV